MTTLWDDIDDHCLVLTANQRLARALHADYARAQQSHGRHVWRRPAILTFAAWQQQCWELELRFGLGQPVRLLNVVQEQALWERVVRESTQGEGLRQHAALARRLREAWALLHAWRLDPGRGEKDGSSDVQAFAHWSRHYQRECERNQWVDHARLLDIITSALRNNSLTAPPRVRLVGFDVLTPQQQAWVEVLNGLDSNVIAVAGVKRNAPVTRCEFPDDEAELRAAAAWIRECVEREPEASIALVVPDLRASRASVERILDETLCPGLLPDEGGDRQPVYNLSLGKPLLQVPVVQAALRALELTSETPHVDALGAFLRSPFFGGAQSEAAWRARLDVTLRQQGELRVSLGRMRGLAQHLAPIGAGRGLLSLLDGWIALRSQTAGRRQTPSQWIETIGELLRILGWPGERGLSSDEYQAVQAWRSLLTSFASLDGIWPRIGFEQVIGRLRTLAAESIHQPQTPELPIQVLGIPEATGLQFDYLWVAGMDSTRWPPPAHANPFLPLAAQRRAGVPYADAEQALATALRLAQGLLTSASECVVSSPQWLNDESLTPSALIMDLALEPRESVPSLSQRLLAGTELQVWLDEVGPVLPTPEVRGGSALFKHQAGCPFRAFAELRLAARPMAAPVPGLDAMVRGSLMHRVLEQVWNVLGDSTALETLEAAELGEIVRDAVGQSLDKLRPGRAETLTERFTELERERLARLVMAWLDVERTREVPFRVAECEYRTMLRLGGLEVAVQIDRIDELSDGTCVLLDYKTRSPSPTEWLGARPDEPQLPLYAQADVGEIAGIAFAQLRPGALGFSGLTIREGLLPRVSTPDKTRGVAPGLSWTQLQRQWRDSLEDLAHAFARGEAAVSPKDYPRTCTHCCLGALCRISERMDDMHEAGNG